MYRSDDRRVPARAFMRLALTLFILCSSAAYAEARHRPQPSSPAAAAEPASIAIVVDHSASMNNSPAGKLLPDLLQRLVETGDDRNEYFIFSVSTSVNLEPEGRHASVDAKGAAKALKRIFSQRRVGATALFDACTLAAVKLSNAKHERRTILLLSDGVDTISTTTFGEVQNLLKLLGIRLSAVVIEPAGSGAREAYLRDAIDGLNKLAKASGGAVFQPTKETEKNVVFESIKALVYP